MRICLTRSSSSPVTSKFQEIPDADKIVPLFGLLRFAVRAPPFSVINRSDESKYGEKMMGMGALENLHAAMHQVVGNHVPGDFVETGVWRGGGTIYMRAFLEAYSESQRRHDSFEGLPKPKDEYEADSGSRLWESEYLAVSMDEVKRNFDFYGLLDERVCFIKGFFSDTMPTAPIDQIATPARW